MRKCYETFDNGHHCTRNATQLNGRCGKCHGITADWKHCTKPAKPKSGKYCPEPNHRTLDEITEHKAMRLRRNRSRSRIRSRRASSASHNRMSYEESSNYSNSWQRSSGPRPGVRRRNSTKKRPTQPSERRPRPKRPLSMATKREAANLCAAAILNQNVFTAFESQITDFVDTKLVDELTKSWNGKQCDELAKIARELLGVSSYLHKILQVIADWLLMKAGYGDIPRLIVRQLVVAIPVPWTAKLVVAARVIQISGMCLCFANDRLFECKCLHDLVQFEGMQAIGRLMTSAIHDWREIANRMPRLETSV